MRSHYTQAANLIFGSTRIVLDASKGVHTCSSRVSEISNALFQYALKTTIIIDGYLNKLVFK
jgi:hypothetical protein